MSLKENIQKYFCLAWCCKPPTNPILVIRYSSPLHGMTNFMLGVSSMAAVILTVAKV